jgi:hypothetical protein
MREKSLSISMLLIGLVAFFSGVSLSLNATETLDEGEKCIQGPGVCERIYTECPDGSHSEYTVYGVKVQTIDPD